MTSDCTIGLLVVRRSEQPLWLDLITAYQMAGKLSCSDAPRLEADSASAKPRCSHEQGWLTDSAENKQFRQSMKHSHAFSGNLTGYSGRNGLNLGKSQVISWFVVLQQKWRFADQEKKV